MNIVSVLRLPECDLCHTPARYDMPLREGRWANLCRDCALLYTFLPMWELQNREPNLGSEYQLVEAVQDPLELVVDEHGAPDSESFGVD